MTNKTADEMIDEMLTRVIEEGKVERAQRAEIVRNGCPHTTKEKRTGKVSRIEYMECPICRAQFDLAGKMIWDPQKGEVK